ncbi:putative sensor-like histidine kinase [compost metagenome]
MQRFEHQLNIEYQIDSRTKPIVIPKMILQPIVENYFKHGFDPSLGIGKLLIASTLIEDNDQICLQLIIENNGLGMSNERLKEVRSYLSSSSKQDGIGLSNVLSRLQLYFDSSASLHINPIHPQGLQFILTIPLKKVEHT